MEVASLITSFSSKGRTTVCFSHFIDLSNLHISILLGQGYTTVLKTLYLSETESNPKDLIEQIQEVIDNAARPSGRRILGRQISRPVLRSKTASPLVSVLSRHILPSAERTKPGTSKRWAVSAWRFPWLSSRTALENVLLHGSSGPSYPGLTVVLGREICCLLLRSQRVISPWMLNRQSLPSAKLELSSPSKLCNFSEHWRLVAWSLPWLSSV
nr:hypothetical protein Iba_chr08eCG7990 [Ipomoea batatas]